MSNDIIVYDRPSGGKPLALPESARIGEGGEGAVYAVPRSGDGKKIAVKIFSKKTLSEKRDFLSRKITAMVEIGKRQNRELINCQMVAWPRVIAYDGNGEFVGYGMQLAEGKTLSRLAHFVLYKKHFPDMNREDVANMLIRLWESAEFLHRHNIYIGDVNTNNVLCSENYEICWIDTDSFQVENWPCPVGRPEMTPLEHLDVARENGYESVKRTRESDLFSLAILTFQCLMLGKHPYAHIGGGDPVDNLRKGHVPYLTGGYSPGKHGAVPPGPWYNVWDWYTHEIKKMVQLALKDGAKDISRRPSAADWANALGAYIRVLNHRSSKHRREMVPDVPKPRGRDPRDLRSVRSINQGENS